MNRKTATVVFLVTLFMIIITLGSSGILQDSPSANPSPTPTHSTSSLPSPTSALQKIVVITFDDGWLSQLNAIQIMDRYGYKATFGIVTNYIDSNYSAYMSWSTIENLAQHGHDIESHTASHESLNDLTVAQLSYELKQSQIDLLVHGINSSILVYPYGDGYNNQTVREAVSRYYQYARTVLPGAVDMLSFDKYALLVSEVEDTTTFDDFKNVVGTQANAVTILCYHKVSYEDDETAVTPEDFALQMQYLHDNGFKILTLKQVFVSNKLA